MTATGSPQGPRPMSIRSVVTTQPVWRVGVLAAVTGAVVTEVFALGARALDVPMKAGGPGAKAAEAIPPFGFAMGVLFWSVVGIVLAVALARWAKRPARIFVVTTVTLTVLSLAGPIMATHTATTTRVVLALSHLVAAAVIIPALAVRLGHREPDRS
ncbi:DUF6069 family protein [Streptomyces sp. KR80]|uniref:DUF6069 family protein n=1 Tax=Streptomyces sp. KR80 TaxID=3457426 RepID=UPI003FD2103E